MTLRNALTDSKIKNVKPAFPKKQLTDGNGLYLRLFWDRAFHSWRMDYKRPKGTRSVLVFGDYPAVSLALAREKAAEARKLLAQGVDPADVRNAAKEAKAAALEAEKVAKQSAERVAKGLPPIGSFEDVARAFWDHKMQLNAWSPSHSDKWLRVLELHVFPHIGHRQCAELKPIDILQRITPLQAIKKIETANCVRTYCDQVCDYAIIMGHAEMNPVASLKHAAKAPSNSKNYPAITDPVQLKALMLAIDEYSGITGACLKMCALTFQRPGNVRLMRWEHVDLDAALWSIPSAEMKRSVHAKETGQPHHVPLAKQAVLLLREMRNLTGTSPYVFHSHREPNKPLTDSAMNSAIYSMGFADKHCPHGFRATARTILGDELGIRHIVIEKHLAHAAGTEQEDGSVLPDRLGASYNRAPYSKARAEMVQVWADYLDAVVAPVAKAA